MRLLLRGVGHMRSLCLCQCQSQEAWTQRDLREVDVVGRELKGRSDDV